LSNETKLRLSISDRKGGVRVIDRTVVVERSLTPLSLSTKLNMLSTNISKTALAIDHLSRSTSVTENDISMTIDVMDTLEETKATSYIKSRALQSLKSNQSVTLQKRLLNTVSSCIHSLNEDSNEAFGKVKETSSNLIEFLSNSISTTTNNSEFHGHVQSINSILDKNLQLGESFEKNTAHMQLSLKKVRFSSLSSLSLSAVQLPSTFTKDLSSFKETLNPKKGLSISTHHYDYVPYASVDNKTLYGSLIDISFSNSITKIPLQHLSEPLVIPFKGLASSLNNSYLQPRCIYYNTTLKSWQSNGVTYENGHCLSYHTTEFAIDLTLVLPQFNTIDLDKHSIMNLNTDNMTVTLILCGMVFVYIMLLCLFQCIDLFSACIRKHKAKSEPFIPIGYEDVSGHKHYIIPIAQRMRDIHQWLSVFLTPNTPGRSYSKQQRLTTLFILILGIMMSNALTVGIGSENETIYVTAGLVADLIIAPLAFISAFLFSKVKPSTLKKQAEQEKVTEDFATFVENQSVHMELKKLHLKMQRIQMDANEPIMTGIWKSVSLESMPFVNILHSAKLDQNIYMLGKNEQDVLMYMSYDTKHNSFSSPMLLDEAIDPQSTILYDDSTFYFVDSHLSVSKWSCKTGLFQRLSLPIESPIDGHALFIHNSQLYCFGGMQHNQLTNQFLLFNVEQGQWTPILLSRTSETPCPRQHALLVSFEKSLYVVSGDDEASIVYKDCYRYSEELRAFSCVSKNLPLHTLYDHVVSEEESTSEFILGFYATDFEMCYINVSDETIIPFSADRKNDDQVMAITSYPNHLSFDQISSTLYHLNSIEYVDVADRSEKEATLEKVEMEQFINSKIVSKSIWNDLRIHFVDDVIYRVARLFQSIDIRKMGIFIILLATLAYFVLLSVGCYMMVYVNWLGVIGTTTYGVLGLLSYLTLMTQLYIQSKRKLYLQNDIVYRSRTTIIAALLLVFLGIISLLGGAGAVYGLSVVMFNPTDRVGVMLIASIFFVGLAIIFFRFAFSLVWAPSRSPNRLISLLERPWFPHWFKFPIYVFSFVEIGFMCWILIMYSIKFHQENMTPDWLIACGFGNSQNFLLDQTLVFIATTFVMTSVLHFFEAMIRPPRTKKVYVMNDDHFDAVHFNVD